MALPYAGTKMGTDGVRYDDDDTARPTTIPPFVDRTLHKKQPLRASAALAADDEHVIPCDAGLVQLNLADANDAPEVTFANPGHRAFAEYVLELVNADDSTGPRIDVPNYVQASPVAPVFYVVGNSPFRLKLGTIVTADVAGNANAATVQTAVDDAFGEDQFVVTSPAANQFVVLPVAGGDYDGLDNEWAFERDEIQTVTPDCTSVTVAYDGGTPSGSLTVADTNGADLEAAIEGLDEFEAGDVSVTGSDGGPWVVTFDGGDKANTDVSALTFAATGGNAACPVVETQKGADGVTLDAVIAPASTKTDRYQVTVIGQAGDEPASVVMVRMVAAA